MGFSRDFQAARMPLIASMSDGKYIDARLKNPLGFKKRPSKPLFSTKWYNCPPKGRKCLRTSGNVLKSNPTRFKYSQILIKQHFKILFLKKISIFFPLFFEISKFMIYL